MADLSGCTNSCSEPNVGILVPIRTGTSPSMQETFPIALFSTPIRVLAAMATEMRVASATDRLQTILSGQVPGSAILITALCGLLAMRLACRCGRSMLMIA